MLSTPVVRRGGLSDDSVRDKLDFEWGGVDHAVRNPLLSGNQIAMLERDKENMNWRPSRTRLDFLPGLLGLLGMDLRVVYGMALRVALAIVIGVGFFAAAGLAQAGAGQAGQTIRGQTRGATPWRAFKRAFKRSRKRALRRAGKRAVKLMFGLAFRRGLRAAAPTAARSKLCTCRGT